MFRHSISFRARMFVVVFAVLALDTLGATDLRAQGGVPARFDKAALSKDVEALLKEHGEGVVANLWVGGDSGTAWFELSADQPSATASAIKTFYLVELFAAHRARLDKPLPGARRSPEERWTPGDLALLRPSSGPRFDGCWVAHPSVGLRSDDGKSRRVERGLQCRRQSHDRRSRRT